MEEGDEREGRQIERTGGREIGRGREREQGEGKVRGERWR